MKKTFVKKNLRKFNGPCSNAAVMTAYNVELGVHGDMKLRAHLELHITDFDEVEIGMM